MPYTIDSEPVLVVADSELELVAGLAVGPVELASSSALVDHSAFSAACSGLPLPHSAASALVFARLVVVLVLLLPGLPMEVLSWGLRQGIMLAASCIDLGSFRIGLPLALRVFCLRILLSWLWERRLKMCFGPSSVMEEVRT